MYFIIHTKSYLSMIILVYAVFYYRETNSTRYYLSINPNSRTEAVMLIPLNLGLMLGDQGFL